MPAIFSMSAPGTTTVTGICAASAPRPPQHASRPPGSIHLLRGPLPNRPSTRRSVQSSGFARFRMVASFFKILFAASLTQNPLTTCFFMAGAMAVTADRGVAGPRPAPVTADWGVTGPRPAPVTADRGVTGPRPAPVTTDRGVTGPRPVPVTADRGVAGPGRPQSQPIRVGRGPGGNSENYENGGATAMFRVFKV